MEEKGLRDVENCPELCAPRYGYVTGVGLGVSKRKVEAVVVVDVSDVRVRSCTIPQLLKGDGRSPRYFQVPDIFAVGPTDRSCSWEKEFLLEDSSIDKLITENKRRFTSLLLLVLRSLEFLFPLSLYFSLEIFRWFVIIPLFVNGLVIALSGLTWNGIIRTFILRNLMPFLVRSMDRIGPI